VKPYHLALFIHGFSGGGAQRRTITLANALAARGHTVDLVVVDPEGVLRPDVSVAVRVIALGSSRRGTRQTSRSRRCEVFGAVPALARYLRQARPEVLLSAASHVNLAAVCAWRLARGATALVLRVSNHLSRSAPSLARPSRPGRLLLARRLYPLADAIIAVSRGVADDVAAITGVPRERITTIHNPVVTPDFERWAAMALEHPWFTPGAPPVLLAAGRFVAQKDFPTLVRAFARVRAVRRVRLVILGEAKRPARRARLEALVRALGVAEDIELAGFVTNAYAYMARAAAFVLSSRWEGLPGVLIEALACGCPVVSTDCPSGPAEILENGRYGPLVPVGDPAALAAATLSVLAAPPARAVLQARAAAFSVETAVDRYENVLLGLVSERRPAVAAGHTAP
jgi:glycosyltransferase involved in cell wall biosynthesis